jgi:hypothetical protein
MRLAPNVVVHDPETNFAKIDSERLRAHGWAEVVVGSMNNHMPFPGLETLEAAAGESEPRGSGTQEPGLPDSFIAPKEAP